MRGINDVEGRTQFSLWCILAAPLMLGTDVRHASAATLATIGNAEAIAINQDALGVQGFDATAGLGGPTPAPLGGYMLNLTACPAPGQPPQVPPAFNFTFSADSRVRAEEDPRLCLTTFDCGTKAGAAVGLYRCVANECGNQLFKWQPAAGAGALASLAVGAEGMCVAPAAPSPAPFSALTLQPCAGMTGSWSWSGAGAMEWRAGGDSRGCVQLPAAPSINLYAKPLAPPAGGGPQPMALAVLNRGAANVPAQTIGLAALGFEPSQRVMVRDVWANTTQGPFEGSIVTRAVASHETLLLRLTLV